MYRCGSDVSVALPRLFYSRCFFVRRDFYRACATFRYAVVWLDVSWHSLFVGL
jgi:hypothetical protein